MIAEALSPNNSSLSPWLTPPDVFCATQRELPPTAAQKSAEVACPYLL